jgi:hypothetical protein
VWSCAALAVVLLLGAGLFVVSQLARAAGEDYCSDPDRVPATAGGYSGPRFVDPVHVRCDYGAAGSRVFTDWVPLLELTAIGLVVLGGVAAIGWTARQLTRTPSPARVSS